MGICGSLMDIFDYPPKREAQKSKYGFTKFRLYSLAALCFAKLGCGSALPNKKILFLFGSAFGLH